MCIYSGKRGIKDFSKGGDYLKHLKRGVGEVNTLCELWKYFCIEIHDANFYPD